MPCPCGVGVVSPRERRTLAHNLARGYLSSISRTTAYAGLLGKTGPRLPEPGDELFLGLRDVFMCGSWDPLLLPLKAQSVRADRGCLPRNSAEAAQDVCHWHERHAVPARDEEAGRLQLRVRDRACADSGGVAIAQPP